MRRTGDIQEMTWGDQREHRVGSISVRTLEGEGSQKPQQMMVNCQHIFHREPDLRLGRTRTRSLFLLILTTQL